MNTEITELKARLNKLIKTESVCARSYPRGEMAQDAYDSGMLQLQEEIDDLREEIWEREKKKEKTRWKRMMSTPTSSTWQE